MSDSNSQKSLQRGKIWPLLLALAFTTWFAWYSVVHCCGPAVVPDGLDSRLVPSAERALKTVKIMAGSGKPHPADSMENERIFLALLELVESLGLQPQTQFTSHEGRQRNDGQRIALKNIWFRIDADDPVEDPMLLMLVSHHDSTPYGPGAADAASGVSALLETARLMLQTPGRHHDVLFLITDGEEFGLLGADRFLQEHPLAKEIDLCINLEARGTSGPSLMFQLSRDSSDLVGLMSKNLQRPHTGSLFDAVYRQLPNDTDFTLFARAGIRGFNFAFIGDAVHYHTTDDSPDNLDQRSLQHHCDNVWQLARAIALKPGRLAGGEEAVWFDVIGQWIVWWPVRWNWPVAIVGLGVLQVGWFLSARSVRREPVVNRADSTGEAPTGRTRILWCAGGTVVMGVAALAMAVGAEHLLRLDDRLRTPWPGDETAAMILVGVFAATLATMALVGGMWQGRGEVSRQLPGWLNLLGIFWGILFCLAAAGLPGAGYLFAVPLVAVAVVISLSRFEMAGGVAAMVPAAAASLVWLWLVPSLYMAIGFRWPLVWPVILVCFGMNLVPPLMLAGTRQLMVVAGTAAVVSAGGFFGAIMSLPGK